LLSSFLPKPLNFTFLWNDLLWNDLPLQNVDCSRAPNIAAA